MIICITGIDGSGKTLQARRLVAQLEASGQPARYVWTGGRAYVSRPLIWLAKRLLKAPRLGKAKSSTASVAPASSSDQYRAYLKSTQKLFKRPLLRAIWRHISLLEHAGEILVVTLPHLLRGRVVVCDRYIYDSLLGIAVLSGATPAELAKSMRLSGLYRLLPQPNKWFFLDLPAAVAFARRTDVVDVEFLERRVPLYQASAAALGAYMLDGTATPDAIEQEIWQQVAPLVAGHSQPKALNASNE